jgi:hypothetical protein
MSLCQEMSRPRKLVITNSTWSSHKLQSTTNKFHMYLFIVWRETNLGSGYNFIQDGKLLPNKIVKHRYSRRILMISRST